jgi:formate dehydrogenase alpha subunit
MINLTIDGKQIQVKKGKTILEAAIANGIRIPHLCYHPGIKPIGSCRICVVEIKPGPPRPLPACTSVVGEGMEVTTNSPRMQDIRRELVKFMLINHPLDCPWCDKGGECYLQDLTHELGIGDVEYEAVHKADNNELASPLIERYNTRCVTCGRCVRVCRDKVGASAINFENRAYFTDLGSGQEPLNCEFCGSCVDICPVGALINKTFKYSARSWELNTTDSICSYCGGGCNYKVQTKDGRVQRIRSEEKLLLCVRGRFGYGVIDAPDRIKTPLIKKEGKFVEASWDEALNYAANGLQQVMIKGGPGALYGVGSPRATNEANYLFQKFFRVAIGTNQLDNPGRYNYLRALGGIREVFGKTEISGCASVATKVPKPFHSPLGIEEDAKGSGLTFVLGDTAGLSKADVILVVGADVTPEMPTYGWRIMDALQNGSCKLIVANARKTKFDRYAHLNLRYKPGSEGWLLGGLMEAVLEAHPGFEPKISAEGFDAFKEELIKMGLKEVKEQSGVLVGELREAGKILAQAQSLAIIFGNDVVAQVDGREKVKAIADLYLLVGQPQNEGSGLYPIADKNNTRGVLEAGVLPNYLPGFAPLDAASPFAEIWKKSIPLNPGLTLTEALSKLEHGDTTAPSGFYLLGGDLVRELPNSKAVKAALQKARFIVAQDAFLNETTKLADVVLPVAIHAELDGTYINTEGRLGQLKAAVSPDGPRPDWQIIAEISRRMDCPMKVKNSEDIFKEMSAGMPIWAGIHAGKRWPDKKIAAEVKGKFVSFNKDVNIPGEGDFILIVGKTLTHSGSSTTHAAGPMSVMPKAALKINPEDAQKLGFTQGKEVKIVSSQGTIVASNEWTEDLPVGVVFLADNFSETPANTLTLNSNLCRVMLQKD